MAATDEPNWRWLRDWIVGGMSVWAFISLVFVVGLVAVVFAIEIGKAIW